MNHPVGTCSICGGRVTVPSVWHGVIPPIPTCESCGAMAAQHGPIIQMQPPKYKMTYTTSDKTVPEQSTISGSLLTENLK